MSKHVKNPVVFVSMSRGGYDAAHAILKKGKRIDVMVTLQKKKASTPGYYVDFAPLAKKYGVKLIKVKHIKTLIPEFQKNRPRVIIVHGWSQLLNKELLDTPLHGVIGSHWSVLPKNRGPAALVWHFVNNEKYGGMTIFKMTPGMDDGPIIGQEKFIITKQDNARTYYAKANKIAAKILVRHFDTIIDGTVKTKKQNERKATYLLKRGPQDSMIDFTKPALNIFNLVRGVFDLYPLAFFNYKGTEYKVGKASLSKASKRKGRRGQIVHVTKTTMHVMARDRVIVLLDIRNDKGVCKNLQTIFTVGDYVNK